VEAAGLDLETVRSAWSAVVADVATRRRSLALVLGDSEPAEVEGRIVTIRLERATPLHIDQAERSENRQLVETLFADHVGGPVRTRFVAGSGGPSLRERRRAFEASLGVRARRVEDDPRVRRLLDEFDGEIVGES
jgi:hypothetical protein